MEDSNALVSYIFWFLFFSAFAVYYYFRGRNYSKRGRGGKLSRKGFNNKLAAAFFTKLLKPLPQAVVSNKGSTSQKNDE